MSNIVEKNIVKKINKMSFEDSMARLEEISQILSSQKINLDQMIDLYEEGNALKEHCSLRLEEAKMKIEKVFENKNAQ